jgi:small subunit ribosomal protein S9
MKEKLEEFVATGRRKTAVASVRLRPGGSGKILINGRPFERFFPLAIQRNAIIAPLKDFQLTEKFDLVAKVKGGGTEGQVIAMRLGIARALVKDEDERRPELKSSGYLKRDPRKKERKKYGLAGARKRFQFSKR